MGGIFPIDEGRGLYGRTQYHKFNVGDNGPVQSVDASILLMYSLGRNFDIFFHVGADFYMSGEEGSDFLGGFGCDKTIWQPTREGYETNHKIKAFFDIAFVDNDFESKGQYLKCFLGLVFYPAQK